MAAAGETSGCHWEGLCATFPLLFASQEILWAAFPQAGLSCNCICLVRWDVWHTAYLGCFSSIQQLTSLTTPAVGNIEARQALGMDASTPAAFHFPCCTGCLWFTGQAFWLQTAFPTEVSQPSDWSPLELSMQGQWATMLPALFRTTRWFSLWKEILFPLYIASMLVISSSAGKLCSIA